MKRKKADELTTDALAKRVFGPEALREIKRQLAEKPAKSESKKKRAIKAKGR